MKLYRFSPVTDQRGLLEVIVYTHFACYQLCKQSFSKYLLNAGNIGIFCHYDHEYEKLTKIRKELTEPSDNPNQKYFLLHVPIVVAANDNVPETTYTYLYIRRPDPYRAQTGDVDFYLEPKEYAELKQSLKDGMKLKGARLFDRADLDMIELYDPDVDALGYVSTNMMTQKVRVKLSDATKL
jgi:hypothetical protein